MKKKKCEICGWDKGIQEHHIIKRNDLGSDDQENIINLCPNHHWVADFGSLEDRNKLLKLFKGLGKIGKKKSKEYIKRIDDLIFAYLEKTFNITEFKEEEKDDVRIGYNYDALLKMFTNKNHPLHYKVCKKAEILLLIKLLNKELDKLY